MNGHFPQFGPLGMRPAMAVFVRPTEERLRFIRQLGVEDIILWGTTFGKASGTREGELAFDEVTVLRNQIENAGMRLFAIENLPAHFVDQIILGGPERDAQVARFQNSIRAAGRARVPVLGYNWVPSGIWRTSYTHPLRGGAKGTAFEAAQVAGAPLRHGRVYSEEELWENYEYFIRRVLPVAEEENVCLAAHPNDPPVDGIAGTPFLLRSPEHYARAFAVQPSRNHGFTFCLGSIAEMGVDVVEVVRRFGAEGRIFYVHFQAVRGAVPSFHETFIDEGDYGGHNAYEVLRALDDVGFGGVMIPGHTPQIEGDVEWRTQQSAAHTPYVHPMGGFRARAYTIGFIKGMLMALEHEKGRGAR